MKKYKISTAPTGRCLMKYRASEPTAAVEAFLISMGFKLDDFDTEIVDPQTACVLRVSRRGEYPTLVILRDRETSSDASTVPNG